MRLFSEKRFSRKAGLPPGTLVYLGEKKIEKPEISLLGYTPDAINEKRFDNIGECLDQAVISGTAWVNINGLHDFDIINAIGERFNIHSLVLEDIVNTEQRPKLDDMDDYLYIAAKMIHYRQDIKQFRFEQVSILLIENCIISFQEDAGDVFEQIRERLRKDKGRIRKMGPDYLLYAILDAIVDGYFIVLENIDDNVENLEEKLILSPEPGILRQVHNLKRDLIFLRRSIWPLREVISTLERGESDLVNEKTKMFFRDVYDHIIQVVDTIDSYRDFVSGMMDLFLNSVSNRMNEVMKMLTIIATIFIPLTFIAGIYGMNFDYMPELRWHWGYPAVLGVMTVACILMIFWFKKKKVI